MKEIIINNLKTLLPTIISIILFTFLWDKINFKYSNPDEIIGFYSTFNYSPLNDNFRYIFFVGFTLLTYLSFYLFFNNKNLLNLKDIFLIEKKNINFDNNKIPYFFLFSFFLIEILYFISNDLNLSKIDLFHEGQALSGALNFKLSNQLWSGSFITTGIFVDVLSANVSWNLFGAQTISSYRYFVEALNLITTFFIIIFIFKLINELYLSKTLRTFIFIIFGFFILSLVNNNAFGYRELPLFIFLITVFETIKKGKINIFSLFIFGLLPIIGLLWSLDRGVFIIAGYIPFIFILALNNKIKDIFIIFFLILFSVLFFYLMIGKSEFFIFLGNSFDILRTADLHNGIIHPSPFSGEDGSARATKNLLFIIITGIILINYVFIKNKNLNKNFIVFLIFFYFVSLVFYKIGVTRSDGGHLKQGISLCLILLIYFTIYNLIFFFIKKELFSFKTNSFLRYINFIIFISLFIYNLSDNFFANIKNYKKNITEYITLEDHSFLSKNEKYLIKELDKIVRDQSCFQVFSYETALTYYLNKPSCTKFHHIFNMGPKQNQLLFIEQLKKTNNKFIIVGGNYEEIGNLKGNNEIKLSAKIKFPYIHEYIMNNYKIYKEIYNWEILIKK